METFEIKPIPGYPGYMAGSDGFIYSVWKTGKGPDKLFLDEPKKLSPGLDSNKKYLLVNVKDSNGYRGTKTVHYLVCITFHGPKPGTKYTVSHQNGNNKDNSPKNLKWETYRENHLKKKEHGTDDCGYRNSRSKITKQDLEKIRARLLAGETHQSISEDFNVARGTISKISNGSRYKGF